MQWWEGWRRRRRRRRPCPRRAFASCRGGRSADCAWLSTVLSDPGRLSGSRRFGARSSRDVRESRLHRDERCSSVSHQARRWEEDEAGAEHRDGQDSGDRGGWGHGAAWSRRHIPPRRGARAPRQHGGKFGALQRTTPSAREGVKQRTGAAVLLCGYEDPESSAIVPVSFLHPRANRARQVSWSPSCSLTFSNSHSLVECLHHRRWTWTASATSEPGARLGSTNPLRPRWAARSMSRCLATCSPSRRSSGRRTASRSSSALSP